MERQKTKVRFTSLDVAAMVQNLQCLVGMRATNIYDLNPSTYLFKLAKSEDKRYLLIENGVRFHTVEEKQDKKAIPSGFTMKFRKFLRSKRLQNIRQVGVERVVVFTFGTEAYTNHLILELYSQGNILLTDSNYRIVQCIRSHEFNDKVKTAVGQIYPFEYAANIYLQNIDVSQTKVEQVLTHLSTTQQEGQGQISTKKKKKQNNKKQGNKLKDVVFKLIPCLFPLVIEHILMMNNMNPDDSITSEDVEKCTQASKYAYKFLKEFMKSSHKGYVFMKQKKQNEDPQYFEYSSYAHLKYKDKFEVSQYQRFDSAVQVYYKHYKKNQHEEQQQFQQLAWKKYDQIKKDQESRVVKLQQEQQIYKLKAEYIEKNIQDVEALIKIIKTMQDNGYSWEDIKRMISESKKNGDPLANILHELNILKRQVTVLLGDPSEEQQYGELLPVQINIDYNAYTNATLYYESKKKNFQKELRTKQASQQVLKIAEKDAKKKIQKKKQEQLSKSVPTRKMFWFEKFYWFISSQGFLIISGRDSHQNELLVKRYMKPGDLYMHSDYGGAASTVIKINDKNVPVPRATLQEAAVFTVCRSKAWDTKILSGAWWVYHDQVSKSAPTGQFLPTGSFMIRGKRNFIQPNRMQMGLTLLYKIDQESVKRHLNDRRVHEDEEHKQKMLEGEKQHGQQYAIISLETNTKNKGKNQKDNKNNKQNQKGQNPQMVKNISEKQEKQEKDDSEKDSDAESDEDSDDDKKKYFNKNQGNTKKGKDQKKQEEYQPKQKMRNKRKMKKLQKYMQEQDDEQRQIIMKMIGAREMKHMKKEEQEKQEQEPERRNKKKNKNKNKNNKKKGFDKYFDAENKEMQQEKLNPDKVLFLKQKQAKQESSSSEQEIKLVNQKKEQQIEEKKQTISEGEEKIQEEQQMQEKEEKSQENQEQEKQESEKEEKQQKQEEKAEEEEVDESTLNSQLAELFKLVGKIHPEDNYENLVPMCAPYSSVKENKFKVKLVPGGLKKGKASRNILHYFSNTIQLTEAEKPFVKSLPEQEVINSLLGNVKLAGAGLLKIELKEKAEKKEKRKEIQKKNAK